MVCPAVEVPMVILVEDVSAEDSHFVVLFLC